MVSFPNCKINIGLRVINKRADGFHQIETIFYPVNIKDVIEIVEQPENAYTQTGIEIPGPADENLCLKAWQLLKKNFPQLPAVNMHLHKKIPIGAGLGGGSADASFMLKLLNTTFSLGLSTSQLINYALQLGSDCPFFIINKPCFATGRGEILEEIALALSPYHILLVNPGIHINTGWAFSQINFKKNDSDLKALIANPVETWQENIFNDFEIPVFSGYPEIAAIKQQLQENGALYASMSGTGSTVFGIFRKEDPNASKFPAHYFCKWV